MPPADTMSTASKTAGAEDTAALKSDVDSIRRDIKQLFEDIKKLTKAEAEMAGRKAQDLRGAAMDAVESRKDDLEEYVKEHPLGALAAAAGVGFILALLVGRH